MRVILASARCRIGISSPVRSLRIASSSPSTLIFGDIVGAAGGAGPGVLLLRLRSPRQAHMRQRVQTAIALTAEALLTGAVVLVEDARIRVRSMRGEE